MHLKPCHKCGRLPMVAEAPGGGWQIACYNGMCDCVPVRYSRKAGEMNRKQAFREWNARPEEYKK